MKAYRTAHCLVGRVEPFSSVAYDSMETDDIFVCADREGDFDNEDLILSGCYLPPGADCDKYKTRG